MKTKPFLPSRLRTTLASETVKVAEKKMRFVCTRENKW